MAKTTPWWKRFGSGLYHFFLGFTLDPEYLAYTAGEKSLFWLGRFFTAFYATGCALATAFALLTLNLIPGGTLLYVLAAVLFCSTFGINWKLCRNSVGKVLIGLKRLLGSLAQSLKAAVKKLLPGKTKTANALPSEEGLTPLRSALLGMGVMCSLGSGLAVGAFTWVAAPVTLSYFAAKLAFLAAISAAFPIIGIVLGALTGICIAGLSIYEIHKSLQQNKEKLADQKFSYKKYLRNLFNKDAEQNKGKGQGRIIAEGVVTLILLTLLSALAIVGTIYMTLTGSGQGLVPLFMKIPNASAQIVGICALFISVVLGGSAELVYTILTSVKTVVDFVSEQFNKVCEKAAAVIPKTFGQKVKRFCFNVLRFINAVGNGLIAALSGQTRVLCVVAGVGGGVKSFTDAAGGEDATDEMALGELAGSPATASADPAPGNSPDNDNGSDAGSLSDEDDEEEEGLVDSLGRDDGSDDDHTVDQGAPADRVGSTPPGEGTQDAIAPVTTALPEHTTSKLLLFLPQKNAADQFVAQEHLLTKAQPIYKAPVNFSMQADRLPGQSLDQGKTLDAFIPTGGTACAA